MGIRKRITIGFLSLALLLFFAGIISMFELDRLRNHAQEIIESSLQNTELSKQMLNAVQIQNRAILQMIILQQPVPDSDYEAGVAKFNEAISAATVTVRDRAELERIYAANDAYRDIVNTHLTDPGHTRNTDWFLNTYLEAYYDLDTAIKEYMTSPQTSIATRTLLLEENAYKTITPSIITLCVAILIVLMFCFFIDLYYVKPILKINEGLRGYLDSHLPFNPTFDGGDELASLKTRIEELIGQIRTQKKQ